MCLKIKNWAIYPVSFRNAVQSMPETVCSISRNSQAGSVRAYPAQYVKPCGLVKPYAIQFVTLRNDRSNRNRCRQNQPGTIAPNRSSLSRSDRAGFFAALRSGDCTAGAMLPYCHARKCFLRVFCNFFSHDQTKQPEQLCPGLNFMLSAVPDPAAPICF